MADTPIKLFVRNIPDNFPGEKFLEILKKQIDGSFSNFNIYKFKHRFFLKVNKICFFTVSNQEIRNKIYDFFQNFELIDPKGIKHKLKVEDSIYKRSNNKISQDSLTNTMKMSIKL